MTIIEVKDGSLILARYIPADAAWVDGLNFFSEDTEFVQVGSWVYPARKELLPHRHNHVDKVAGWTQEVLYIRKGKIRADIYNSAELKISEIIASEGDVLILLAGGHGYTILEDKTEVLEIKNGPYFGAEMDRRRIQIS